MAGRYLPTELQNDDGDVIYPHSSAEVIWMQDGRSVEATIGEKSSVIMTTGEIPVEQRKENNIYLFKKEDGTTQIEDYQGHKIYPRPDMLSTMEEVEANTTANKSVDALVVKELNSCLNSINNKLQWTKVGSAIGKGLINLPITYNELLIQVTDTHDNSIYENVFHNFGMYNYPAYIRINGEFRMTNYGSCCIATLSSNTIQVFSLWLNGSEVTSRAKLDVWYR